MWSNTASFATAAEYNPTTFFPNAKVMVIGADNRKGAAAVLNSAELYDPASGSWSPTANNLATRRRYHTATLLADGRVLVAGGYNQDSGGMALGTAGLYDPTTGVWSATGNLATAPRNHTANLLPNGKGLVVGGVNTSNQ